jgi:hypothetical protein
MYKIRFYNREHIINTKRIEKKVSREEAIRLVAEDRERARAENIILKQQMKEKLARLDWYQDLRRARDLVKKKKENGINIDFVKALFQV